MVSMLATPVIQCLLLIVAAFSCGKANSIIAPSYFVENILLQSKNTMDIEEFSYLTDIHIGKTYTEDDLQKARDTLSIKKRFKSFSLTTQLNPTTNCHTIVCSLEPNIILKRVKIRGILTNKTQYESLYSLQAGEIFSLAQHQASIKAIKARLISEGFLNGGVTSSISKNEDSHTVKVTINLDTGPRFFIQNIQYALNMPTYQSKEEHTKDIQVALTNIFNPLVHRYQYTQSILKTWTKKIRENLINLGFLNPKIHVKIVANKETRKVKVIFVITHSTPRFIVQGNRACTQRGIFNALIAQTEQKWGLKSATIKHQLKLLYQTNGFWKANIEILPTNDTILVSIDEGHPLNVTQIIIHDDKKRPLSGAVMSLCKIGLSSKCTDLFIKERLQKIVSTAIKQGFWDCKIKRTKILIPKSAPQTCILDICVAPGTQRILEKMTVTHIGQPPHFKTAFHPEAHQNIPFDPHIITSTRRSLLSELYQNGYWYASVDCTLTPLQTTQSSSISNLSMSCKINPGDQVRFGKIVTQGYSKLPFKNILKNCQLEEGTLWDQKKVDRARSRLHHLGIFEHVQLTPHQLTHHKSPKHIIANILDDDPYEARLKIGMFASSDAPFLEEASAIRLAGTYLIKNPLNKADIFSMTAQADTNEQLMAAQYSVPDLFGTNQLNSVLISTESHRYMLNLCEPIEAALERRSGIRVSAYQPLSLNEPQIGWSAGIDHSRLIRHYGNMDLDSALTEKELFFVYFTPMYKKISIDERKTMSEGLETFAELKFSFPIISHGNSPAIRGIFRQRFAKNLHRNLGIILTLRCGHLFSDGAFASIHPNDRFYLGGADTIRGYSRDTLPPLGTYTMRNGETGYTVQGGRGMLQINLELRYRINRNAELQFFHDLGALSQNSVHELFTRRYRTLGVGTRLYTPVGIIKFDIGWKLQRSYPEEHTYNWHLSFDGSF
jgi:outer membrane protein assembly factor BamA